MEEAGIPSRPLHRGQAMCAQIMIDTGTRRSAGAATLRLTGVRCLGARKLR